MPSRSKEKPIFKNLVIAIAGDLGGQWTETNICRWVSLRSGRFSLDMDESVTHLVCSAVEFNTRSKHPWVTAALKSKGGKVKVVTKDWLEDSIMKGKRLGEKEFELGEVLRKEREEERRKMRVVRGMELGERGVDPNLFHVYCDSTFFRYAVTITNEEGARYELTFWDITTPESDGDCLYQSNASQPYLYWFCAKFYKRKGDSSPKYYRPSPCSGLFRREFAHFETFFHKKTGVPWEQRLVAQYGEGKNEKAYFRYEPPTGGKPVGYVPEEFMPVEGERGEGEGEEDGNALGMDDSDASAAVLDGPEETRFTQPLFPGTFGIKHLEHVAEYDSIETSGASGADTDVPMVPECDDITVDECDPNRYGGIGEQDARATKRDNPFSAHEEKQFRWRIFPE